MSHQPQVHDSKEFRIETDGGMVSLKKYDGGPIMLFSHRQWNEFLSKAKAGEYDLPPDQE